MNYQDIYNQIIERARLRATSKKEANIILGYSEAHHILPKCLGGANDKSNIVHLSAREHFIAHLLLVKIYVKEPKLLYACNRLMYDNQGNKLNGKSYDWFKKLFSSYRKTQNKTNNPGIAKMARTKTGRTKHNNPGVAAQAKAIQGRTKENHPGIAKISEKKRGRTKENNESVARGAAKLTGRTKETCPGLAQMSQTLSGRTKETHSYLEKAANKRRGRTKETCLGLARMAEKVSILPQEIRDTIFHQRSNGIPGRTIYTWLTEELGYEVSYSIISTTYNRMKQKMDKINHPSSEFKDITVS